MNKCEQPFADVAGKIDIVAGLHRALDCGYGRVRRAAQLRWQQHYADVHETENQIVTVRITAQPRAVRGSGFLNPSQRRGGTHKLTRPRFAH